MYTVWWMWAGFCAFVVLMLVIDLYLTGSDRAHRVSTREALSWVMVWISLALLFDLIIWWYLNEIATPVIAKQKALEFLTGYLIEKSLSIDNMFIFLLIFNHFAVPKEYQRRILSYGVLGAIFMRLILILLGVWIVNKVHAILYVFGFFLVFTGIKMFFASDKEPNLVDNRLIRWLKRHLPITHTYHNEKFFVHEQGKLHMTPLFLVLILIEISDLIFAVDSIPAIFAITTDPFIIFTSNIFAIMGLRSLYFLLAGMADRFYLLKYALAFILTFVGLKMLIAPWFTLPILLTLGIIAMALALSVVASLRIPQKPRLH